MDLTKVKRRTWRPLVAVASALVLAATLLPMASASAAGGSPPLNLVATASPGAVTLAWDAPESDAATVTGYWIRRRLPDEGESRFTTISTDTGSTDTTYTDLTANGDGTRYEYRVKALRNDGRSRRSNTAEAIGQAASAEEPGEVIGTSLEYVSPPEPEPVISQQQQAVNLPAAAVCSRPDPIDRQGGDRSQVKDFKLYVLGSGGLQRDDYLEWISPITVSVDTVESYTVERQQRIDDSWSSWTDLGTHCNQHGRHRYTILEDQPPCTDWAIRVWANFFDGTSGPWKKKFSITSQRHRPYSPSLSEDHEGSLGSQQLTAKWTRAACQTEYEVEVSRRDGITHPSDGYDDDGNLIGINDGWSAWVTPEFFDDGTDSAHKFTLNFESFEHQGDGVRMRVRLRNRAGWSNWSKHVWQRGFRVHTVDAGETLITRY
ncbi:fibronectin type III domain-containing protein [Candidatus Poriferisodalis sp.]|uniref:fibronectin type III domain-containing protein n=1 Tax=Candidatus Poriferisodalis sp. TaxID=3101277 RepID=UPI003B51DEB6